MKWRRRGAIGAMHSHTGITIRQQYKPIIFLSKNKKHKVHVFHAIPQSLRKDADPAALKP